MDIRFPVGNPLAQQGPLARFMPPLAEGAARSILEDVGAEGDLLLDPFGASPRLIREAAGMGRAIVVAVSNPVTRFVLHACLRPFRLPQLQSALAHLASARKDGSRMEPFILDLYRSHCNRCGAEVIADYFVWDRELHRPVLKEYACLSCGHVGEEAISSEDLEQALSYERRGLHHALALEAVTPPGDRHRHHAEAALAVYPGRALYALMTLTNKLDQLSLEPRVLSAAQALLLSAFDAANALWGHPEGRPRPRQLMASSRFREVNTWRAIERGVEVWALPGPEVPLMEWSEGRLPPAGAVAVFGGPARNLAPQLARGMVGQIATVVPRPNQAFWTLSALWAAWLWGRRAATPIKMALGRRRYDWGWTAEALRAVMASLRPVLEVGTPAVTFVTEAEPGFVAAALTGFESADFRLTGRALRLDTGLAVFCWEAGERRTPSRVARGALGIMSDAMARLMKNRGEPTLFPLLHAAALAELGRKGQLARMREEAGGHPLTELTNILEKALLDWRRFRRLDQRVEPESGLYWLADATGVSKPLADRVERLVLELLRQEKGLSETEIDRQVCGILPGLLTPERNLVRACLRSYAFQGRGDGLWRLKEQDRSEKRAKDCGEIRLLLREIGLRLGFVIEGEGPLRWLSADGEEVYHFEVQETAELGAVLAAQDRQNITVVLPGGRSSLLMAKARRDPRVKRWMSQGARVLKFRLVRRLAEDAFLNPENLAERMALDPPERQDSQMPLL